MANGNIREFARQRGVHLWQVGEALGLRDYEFSRKLRYEFSEQEREKIIRIIETLART